MKAWVVDVLLPALREEVQTELGREVVRFFFDFEQLQASAPTQMVVSALKQGLGCSACWSPYGVLRIFDLSGAGTNVRRF